MGRESTEKNKWRSTDLDKTLIEVQLKNLTITQGELEISGVLVQKFRQLLGQFASVLNFESTIHWPISFFTSLHSLTVYANLLASWMS